MTRPDAFHSPTSAALATARNYDEFALILEAVKALVCLSDSWGELTAGALRDCNRRLLQDPADVVGIAFLAFLRALDIEVAARAVVAEATEILAPGPDL